MNTLTIAAMTVRIAKTYNELRGLAEMAGAAKDEATFKTLEQKICGVIMAAEGLGIDKLTLLNKARALRTVTVEA